jgi:stage II sporulation protein D
MLPCCRPAAAARPPIASDRVTGALDGMGAQLCACRRSRPVPISLPRASAALRRQLPLLILPASLLLPMLGTTSSRAFPTQEELRQQPSSPDVMIRVLLAQEDRLTVAAGSDRLRISDARGALLHELAPGEELRLAAGPSGLNLEQRVAVATAPAAGLRELWIAPPATAAADALVLVGGKGFRGRVQLRLNGRQVQAINHLPLETYLMSVVGSEMPASWPQAALQAQAVAARTYALARRRPAEVFDVKATVASQVYRGVAGETASTREAVASTRGQVLLYNNAPIEAVFHSSSSSGRTESSGELWNQQLPYLVSVPDFDKTSPVRRWRVLFEPADLQRLFPETGGVQRIDVLTLSNSGRIRRARIVGPLGAQLLTGAQLRERLGLRSTLVQLEWIGSQPQPAAAAAANPEPAEAATLATARLASPATREPEPLPDSASGAWGSPPAALPPLPAARSRPALESSGLDKGPAALVVEGLGFGHGVGMSQWGAYGMALQGKTYGEILLHYYRGVTLQPYRASRL